MLEYSMALRYDDRGSNFSKPYYNGRGGGNSGSGGREKNWNGGGRFSGEVRDSVSSSAENHLRKHERKNQTVNRNHENWDNRSSAGDSDKGALRQVGDWTEQLSSAGKKYYYNCRTEVSQWEKPAEWIAWEKRMGLQDQSRKRRAECQTGEEMNSPSHSSTGRPSSSRDQYQSSQQRRSGGHDDFGGSYDNADGRNYGGHMRRPYAGGNGGANRPGSSDFSRGARPRYGSRGGGSFPANRQSFDGQTSRHDQQAYLNNDRSRRPAQNDAASTSRELDGDDLSRERSPKRPRFSTLDHGTSSRNGPDNRNVEKQSSQQQQPAERDDEDDNVTANVQIDMERLPHLLVEIAEKNNIDLSDPDALEKIKRHLQELQSGALPKNETKNCRVSPDKNDDGGSKATERLTSGKEDELLQADQAQPVDSAPTFTQESIAALFNEELVAHIRGWSAEHFEVQASHLASASFRVSLNVTHILADLKCARSLVRTAEIRSTLLEQRIAYLRQQYHELETMSKPTAPAPAIPTSLATS